MAHRVHSTHTWWYRWNEADVNVVCCLQQDNIFHVLFCFIRIYKTINDTMEVCQFVRNASSTEKSAQLNHNWRINQALGSVVISSKVNITITTKSDQRTLCKWSRLFHRSISMEQSTRDLHVFVVRLKLAYDRGLLMTSISLFRYRFVFYSWSKCIQSIVSYHNIHKHIQHTAAAIRTKCNSFENCSV